MSYQSTKEVLGILNSELQARYEEGIEGYGFLMNGYDENTHQTLKSVARSLGHPDLLSTSS